MKQYESITSQIWFENYQTFIKFGQIKNGILDHSYACVWNRNNNLNNIDFWRVKLAAEKIHF